MMLRIALVPFIILLISSCTLPGTQTEGAKQEGTIKYSGSGFAMYIPTGWDTKPKDTMLNPRIGELVLTAVSPEIRYGFSNNIVIMKDSLQTLMTSKKYSELNQIQTMKNYLEYSKISDKAILFSDDDESRITVFEAKYNSTTPKMKFIQTIKACGTSIFLIHASIALDKSTDSYVDLFRTFSCD